MWGDQDKTIQWVKKQLFVHWNNCLTCGHPYLHTLCVCYSLVLWLVSQCLHTFHTIHLLAEVGACLSTCLSSVFSYCCRVTPHPTLYGTLLQFHFIFPKSHGIPFSFGLTVPQFCVVLVCKSWNKSGEEKKLFICNLFCAFLILIVSPGICCIADNLCGHGIKPYVGL